jgi:hypothetical protein
MAVEASQPLKISLPVSAALAQALWNEVNANTPGTTPPTQYTFVKINSTGQADLISANSDLPIGVIQNRPVVNSQGATQIGGKTAEIVVVGVTKLCAGGAVTLGGATGFIEMTTTAAILGSGIAAGAVTGGSKTILGQFLSAGASGDKLEAIVACVTPLPTGN